MDHDGYFVVAGFELQLPLEDDRHARLVDADPPRCLVANLVTRDHRHPEIPRSAGQRGWGHSDLQHASIRAVSKTAGHDVGLDRKHVAACLRRIERTEQAGRGPTGFALQHDAPASVNVEPAQLLAFLELDLDAQRRILLEVCWIEAGQVEAREVGRDPLRNFDRLLAKQERPPAGLAGHARHAVARMVVAQPRGRGLGQRGVQRGGGRVRLEPADQALGSNRIESNPVGGRGVDHAVERNPRQRHVGTHDRQRRVRFEHPRPEEGQEVLAGVGAHRVREIERGLGLRDLGQTSQRCLEAPQVPLGSPALLLLVGPGETHRAVDAVELVQERDHLRDPGRLPLGGEVPLVAVVFQPLDGVEQPLPVGGQRLDNGQPSRIGNDHRLGGAVKQLVDQLAREIQRRLATGHRQVRLIDVKEIRGVEACGCHGGSRAIGRRLTFGDAAKAVELKVLQTLEIDLDPEIVRGEGGHQLGRSEHADVQLGEALPGALHQADLPRLFRVAVLVGPGQLRRGREQRQADQVPHHDHLTIEKGLPRRCAAVNSLDVFASRRPGRSVRQAPRRCPRAGGAWTRRSLLRPRPLR